MHEKIPINEIECDNKHSKFNFGKRTLYDIVSTLLYVIIFFFNFFNLLFVVVHFSFVSSDPNTQISSEKILFWLKGININHPHAF